jgi:hypothetical protein
MRQQASSNSLPVGALRLKSQIHGILSDNVATERGFQGWDRCGFATMVSDTFDDFESALPLSISPFQIWLEQPLKIKTIQPELSTKAERYFSLPAHFSAKSIF